MVKLDSSCHVGMCEGPEGSFFMATSSDRDKSGNFIDALILTRNVLGPSGKGVNAIKKCNVYLHILVKLKPLL